MIAKHPILPVSYFADRIDYEPESGFFYWKELDECMFSTSGKQSADHVCARWNARNAGKRTFTTLTGRGYYFMRVEGRIYLAHRVAWALHYGEWPNKDLDHINRVKADNRIINLRLVNNAQNNANTSSRANSSSRFIGVTWNARVGKWAAQIREGKKNLAIGYFESETDAARARDQQARRIYGEFASLNFSEVAC